MELRLELARVMPILELRLDDGEGDYMRVITGELDCRDLLWRRSSGGPSQEDIQYFCKLAYLSQSFYRCIAPDQWVWTVIRPQHPDFEIRSNVVPRQAYRVRLEQGANASCTRDCIGGFVSGTSARITVPCAGCALADQLIDGNMPFRRTFWDPAGVASVRDHGSLGQGSQAEVVKKVLWRKGVFARKRFACGPEFQGDNEVLTREFDAFSITHPNLVHCFGWSIFQDDHLNYCDLLMELLDGDLQDLLEQGGRMEYEPGQWMFSFRDVLDVLLQIAEAMRRLHEHGFVHADLKPGNIFVSKLPMPHDNAAQFYLVKVGDFGTTQRVGRVFDYVVGTTKYSAPEIFRCRNSPVFKRRYDEGAPAPPALEHPQKIDVYSFGVVAYQVITGEPEVYVDVKRTSIESEVIAGLRPLFNLEDGSLDDDRSSLLPLIQSCWSADPQSRPSFLKICEELSGRLVEYDHRLRSELNAKRMLLQRIDPLGDCPTLPQRSVQGIMISGGLGS